MRGALARNRNRIEMFERLEPRLLLAGNVRASLTKSGLIIRADDASNGIEIRRVDNHTVKMQGFTVSGAPTSINGRPNGSVTLETYQNVTCYLYGGADDRLTIEGAARERPATFRKQFTVYGGDGRDIVQVKYVSVLGDCKFSLGAGDDRLTLRYLYTAGDLTTYGGDAARQNNKSIDIRGNNYVAGDTKISLGNGDDLVRLSRFSTDRLDVYLRDGSDTLAVDLVHAEGGSFHGGAARDTLQLGANDFSPLPRLLGFDLFA